MTILLDAVYLYTNRPLKLQMCIIMYYIQIIIHLLYFILSLFAERFY